MQLLLLALWHNSKTGKGLKKITKWNHKMWGHDMFGLKTSFSLSDSNLVSQCSSQVHKVRLNKPVPKTSFLLLVRSPHLLTEMEGTSGEGWCGGKGECGRYRASSSSSCQLPGWFNCRVKQQPWAAAPHQEDCWLSRGWSSPSCTGPRELPVYS